METALAPFNLGHFAGHVCLHIAYFSLRAPGADAVRTETNEMIFPSASVIHGGLADI